MINKPARYKICIVDDELHARDVIKKYVKRITGIEMELSEANNGLDAIEVILREKPDILFLDIQMPELSGFEVLENIKAEISPPAFIFTTAYDKFAIQAFEINAIDYLLKPFDFERFHIAFEKAVMAHELKNKYAGKWDKLLDYLAGSKQTGEQPRATRLLIKENKKAFFVNTSDIQYVEAANYYCSIFTRQGKKHLLTLTLGQLEAKLNPDNFARIHRSSIINLEYVKELIPHFNGEYIVVMQNGVQLKLSRSYKKNLSNHLL
ncbi:MAG TPA: LytTR family DNA-binding domain-containing protein [Chitinophagaceae bacterium]|nr:LytTR family DNA-binding domain-containing protein [Chitinophagaceae bacterium]